jgi:hypothetical protein
MTAMGRVLTFRSPADPMVMGISRAHRKRAGATLATMPDENAALMANHASTRATQLYDRHAEEVTLDEVERILV